MEIYEIVIIHILLLLFFFFIKKIEKKLEKIFLLED